MGQCATLQNQPGRNSERAPLRVCARAACGHRCRLESCTRCCATSRLEPLPRGLGSRLPKPLSHDCRDCRFKDFERRLNLLTQHLTHPASAMRKIAQTLETLTDQNFAAQGRPGWKPLAGATIRARLGGKGLYEKGTSKICPSLPVEHEDAAGYGATGGLHSQCQRRRLGMIGAGTNMLVFINWEDVLDATTRFIFLHAPICPLLPTNAFSLKPKKPY